jgi:hypothetical protein
MLSLQQYLPIFEKEKAAITDFFFLIFLTIMQWVFVVCGGIKEENSHVIYDPIS